MFTPILPDYLELPPEPEVLHQDDWTYLITANQEAWLFYRDDYRAGAVGQAQGQALVTALTQVTGSIKILNLIINSSGADVTDPLEGLYWLNEILEVLCQLKKAGITLKARISHGVFGGMGIALTTVVDKFILTDKASIGLLGPKILEIEAHPIPQQGLMGQVFKRLSTW